MSRFLRAAAVLLVTGALGAFPSMPPGLAQQIPGTMRVTFVNHLAVQLRFTVDDIYACTAEAGRTCSYDVTLGKHVFKALEGTRVIRTLEATVSEDDLNPRVIVSCPTLPGCP